MKKTTDIWFTTYLLLRDYEVADFECIAHRRGEYAFAIEDAAWVKLKLDYMSSNENNIRRKLEEVKNLVA